MPKFYNKHVLPNGLRVITVPRPEAVVTNVLVMAATGSKYETKEQNGLSHFLEHMCFKGTKRRPKPKTIAAEFDALGAGFNAFTAQEYTGYYATVQSKFFDRALDLLADMYLNSTIPEGELEKERGVIIEEINMYEDMPKSDVQDLFMGALYGDQPAGWKVIGAKDNIRSLKREDFLNYRASHYVAGSTIVVVAGRFNESAVLKQIARQFASLHDPIKPSKLPVVEAQKKPHVLLKKKDSDQTHLVLGFRAFPANHRSHEAVEVLSAVLGGSMSSRLFTKIRDELGAAYYVHSSNDVYTDHGALQVAVGTDNNRPLEIIRVVLEECAKLRDALVPAKELERAVESLVGNFLLGLEKTSSRAYYYALEEVEKGRLASPEQVAKHLRAVRPVDVRAVAREIFAKDRLNLALIGPFADSAKFESALKL